MFYLAMAPHKVRSLLFINGMPKVASYSKLNLFADDATRKVLSL